MVIFSWGSRRTARRSDRRLSGRLTRDVKNGMRPVPPGEMLREALDTLGLAANALARVREVPGHRDTLILNGQRGVTADTALRLARYFGTPPLVAESAADLGTPLCGAGDGPRDHGAGPVPAASGVAGQRGTPLLPTRLRRIGRGAVEQDRSRPVIHPAGSRAASGRNAADIRRRRGPPGAGNWKPNWPT